MSTLLLALACATTAPSTPPPLAAPTPVAVNVAVTGHVDHIGLTVTDLAASQALFVDVLGFELRGSDADYPAVFLNNGSTGLTLWQATEPETAAPFDRKNNVGLHHLAISVPNFETLDALYTQLKAYPGVVIEFAPELSYGGPAKHMMFAEPSGNRVELIHRPR